MPTKRSDHRNNAQVAIFTKEVMRLDKKNYRSMSILFHPYKLLTKIIRPSNKIDSCQPPEQVFWFSFIKLFGLAPNNWYKTLVYNKDNLPQYVAFIHHNTAFGSIELWAIFQAMDNARIDGVYRDHIGYFRNMYAGAMLHIKLQFDRITNSIEVQRGVRQETSWENFCEHFKFCLR